MAFDQTVIRFKSALISVAHDYGGSVESPDAEMFVSGLYNEWIQCGEPVEKCVAWLKERLRRCFESVDAEPVWVEEEPSWPFHNGQPMVFISQTTMGKHEPAASKLSPGETIYVFGARSPEAKGFRMVYRIVSQFK